VAPDGTDNISDMLKLAELKGWLLETLQIQGSEKFVAEAKKQINKKLEKTVTKHHKINIKR
jgi:hypothetical protein